jgi:hypothetical protein
MVVLVVEAIVGISVAGALLAIVVPLLIEHSVIAPGDGAGVVLITSVLLLAIGVALFRPGSALRRSKS